MSVIVGHYCTFLFLNPDQDIISESDGLSLRTYPFISPFYTDRDVVGGDQCAVLVYLPFHFPLYRQGRYQQD